MSETTEPYPTIAPAIREQFLTECYRRGINPTEAAEEATNEWLRTSRTQPDDPPTDLVDLTAEIAMNYGGTHTWASVQIQTGIARLAVTLGKNRHNLYAATGELTVWATNAIRYGIDIANGTSESRCSRGRRDDWGQITADPWTHNSWVVRTHCHAPQGEQLVSEHLAPTIEAAEAAIEWLLDRDFDERPNSHPPTATPVGATGAIGNQARLIDVVTQTTIENMTGDHSPATSD